MMVSTTAGTGLKGTNKYLTKYVGKIWGFRTVTSLWVMTPPYE